MLIQDSSSKTGCYTTKDYFMSLKVHADFECSSLDTTLHRRDTLVTTRLWSSYPETFGGPKCGKPWRTTSRRVTPALDPRSLIIGHTGYFNRCRFQKPHGHPYPWTSLWTFQSPNLFIHFLLWWTAWQRWHTSCLVTRLSQVKKRHDFSWRMCTNIIDFPTTSSLIMVRSSCPSSGNPCSRSYKWRSIYHRRIILRRMDKLNEWIKYWSSI